MEVPAEVLEAAKGLVDEFGANFDRLGEREGVVYYSFVFPDNLVTGFPIVFSYVDGKPVDQVNGFDALDIVCSFTE